MAHVREGFTKDGKRYFRIRCHRGRDKGIVSKNWYVPEGWSEKTVQRTLLKVVSDFENAVNSGEIVSEKERKQAEREEQARISKIQSFQQYAEQVYLPGLRVTASRLTMDGFERNLKLHIYPHIGAMKITEIGPADIKALLLQEQKNLGIDTVQKIYTILKLVFKAAYIEEVIERNPMDKIQRPTAKKEEVKREGAQAYTAEEVAYIMEALQNEPLQWQCYIWLLIDTGCRRGEACGLQWRDLDIENNSISFSRELCYTPSEGIYIDTLKNRKNRRIFIDPELKDLLLKLKKDKTQTNEKVVNIGSAKMKDQKDERFIFTQILSQSSQETVYSDKPMHPVTPSKYFKKFGQKYSIEDFHPHKLRHSFASVAITSGADVVSVSQKLGHSDVAVTLRVYAHASDESQKQASDIFRNALKSAKKKDQASGDEKR